MPTAAISDCFDAAAHAWACVTWAWLAHARTHLY